MIFQCVEIRLRREKVSAIGSRARETRSMLFANKEGGRQAWYGGDANCLQEEFSSS